MQMDELLETHFPCSPLINGSERRMKNVIVPKMKDIFGNDVVGGSCDHKERRFRVAERFFSARGKICCVTLPSVRLGDLDVR